MKSCVESKKWQYGSIWSIWSFESRCSRRREWITYGGLRKNCRLYIFIGRFTSHWGFCRHSEIFIKSSQRQFETSLKYRPWYLKGRSDSEETVFLEILIGNIKIYMTKKLAVYHNSMNIINPRPSFKTIGIKVSNKLNCEVDIYQFWNFSRRYAFSNTQLWSRYKNFYLDPLLEYYLKGLYQQFYYTEHLVKFISWRIISNV